MNEPKLLVPARYIADLVGFLPSPAGAVEFIDPQPLRTLRNIKDTVNTILEQSSSTGIVGDDLPRLLRAVADSSDAKANNHDLLFNTAAAEIERARIEARDAARWNALVNCSRMHLMGSSGFDVDADGNHKSRPGPLLFGMEFWSYHPAANDPEDRVWRERRRNIVIEFADACIKRTLR